MNQGVSVVITLFNKEEYVATALGSVARQSFSDFEIVVVDDGSTDQSLTVVAAFSDPRLKLVRQSNQGEGAARNRGIRESRGELIAMLDADDEWDPQFLETVVALWRKFPEAGLFATGYRTRHHGALVLETSIPGCDDGRLVEDYFAQACRASIVWSSAQAVPRCVFDSVGGFSDAVVGADLDMWGRIALRYPVACSSRVLATYHNDLSGYRVMTHHRRSVVFPTFVRSAREAIAHHEVSAGTLSQLQDYLDHLMLGYVQRVVAAGDRRELRRVLRQEFRGRGRSPRGVAAWRLVSWVMPLWLATAVVRLKSSRWAWAVGAGGGGGLVRRAAS